MITNGVKVGGKVWLGRSVGVLEGIREGVLLGLREGVLLGMEGSIP